MATLTIPTSAQKYFPKTVDPSQLWVNYSPKADSLTIYFTEKPVPTVWSDIDKYAYVGFAVDNTTKVTGLMIEHFSKWLFDYGGSESQTARLHHDLVI
jgi:hypothetical protein